MSSNQAGLSTGDMASRILEKEPEKLLNELKEKQKSLGLRDMKPTRNQGILQQLKDIDEEKNNILDRMQMEKENRLRRTAEQRKANQKSFKEKLAMYLNQQERKAKDAYGKRRIVFSDGGFEECLDGIRMTSCRVLVKEIRDEQRDLILVPESHTEKFPKNTVVAVADDVDEVNVGDVVIADAYAGIEVVSQGNVYRILFDSDILCKLEN